MKGLKISLYFLLILLPWYYLAAQDTGADYFNSVAQGTAKYNFIFGVSGGYGKYLQSDLKEINRTVQKGLNFETTMTDNFPPALYFGVHVFFRLNKYIIIGPDYQFHTTGSRLAYKDYSGSYTFDQIISCHSPALQVEGSLNNFKNPQFCLGTLCGINISKWKLYESLVVGKTNESSSTRFDAVRPFICPSIKIRYRITHLISIVPSVSYNIDLWGKYHLHNQKEAKSDYTASWIGPRADLSIDLLF